MTPRPDELSAEAEVERYNRLKGMGSNLSQTAVGLGASALGAGAISASGLMGKIAPFLSKYVPKDLALKGINKVSPKLGKFIQAGLDQGLSLESGFDFLRNQSQPKEKDQPEKSEEAIDARSDNPIWKFSKKLASFVEQAFKTGHTLDEVYGMALSPGNKFKKDVDHIEKSIGMPFRDILRSIFGGESDKKQRPQAVQGQQGMQQQAPIQKPGPSQNPVESAFMETLKNINSKMANL